MSPTILPAAGLKRLLPDHPTLGGPVHLVYLPDRQMTPKLVSFIDFAMREFD